LQYGTNCWFMTRTGDASIVKNNHYCEGRFLHRRLDRETSSIPSNLPPLEDDRSLEDALSHIRHQNSDREDPFQASRHRTLTPNHSLGLWMLVASESYQSANIAALHPCKTRKCAANDARGQRCAELPQPVQMLPVS